jgi:hypothetical protein
MYLGTAYAHILWVIGRQTELYEMKEAPMTSTEPSVRSTTSHKSDSHGICWDISPLPSGTGTLKLSGDLKPGWLGRLSSNLTNNNINIINGSARKCAPLAWEAAFEVDSPGLFTGFDPLPAVAAPAERVVAPALTISNFNIEYTPRHDGSIYVEISGKDCIGFLYGVMRIFSFYSLFPAELEVSTRGKTAHDKFWLKGIGSSAPERDDMTLLHNRLLMMLPGKA